ncbi:MAG: exodeoxyribonuclease VII large subunit [Oscillospiraceae bacterium]|nr:exodeoxyribonuclease VII large subunit [Oscillospiraceae bacterium]
MAIKMNLQSIISVSQLNTYARSLLEGDENLRNVFVRGEISNFTANARSGHLYMSLKDTNASIKAVMFAGNASQLKFRIENGMSVIVRGRVSLYERDGAFQLYIDDIQPEGIGSLAIAFEQLKEKLSNEGIFDSNRKKQIPPMPKRIGVISSPNGAAVQDVLNVISRRFPLADIVFAGAPVQGDGAGEIIARAVVDFNYLNCVDVIIIARGGGSAEDLWEFNNENLARAIYNSEIPVISGVGHETDFTICDFAADLRAPTPSAAAELAVPDIYELASYINLLSDKINKAVSSKILLEEMRLDKLADSGYLKKPADYIDECNKTLADLDKSLNNAVKSIFENKYSQAAILVSKLDALSPLKILSRGFSVIKSNNSVVSSVNQLSVGESIELKFSDGTANAVITQIKDQVK